MGTEIVEIIRYYCDGTPRLDCWGSQDYDCDEDAEEDGWVNDGKIYLCPYCSFKEK